MGKVVLTDEEKAILKGIANEVRDIRAAINQLSEKLAKLSDKEFLKQLNAEEGGVSEGQVDKYQLAMQKKLDSAEGEFRY